MIKLIIQSIRQTILWTVVTGIAYPLVMTVIAQLAFQDQANGSLVVRDGKVVGSALLAQQFRATSTSGRGPRRAVTPPVPSGASNLGPTSAALQSNVTGQCRGDSHRQQAAGRRTGAGGHGVHLRQRAGPAHQPRGGATAGRPRRRRARCQRGSGQARWWRNSSSRRNGAFWAKRG